MKTSFSVSVASLMDRDEPSPVAAVSSHGSSRDAGLVTMAASAATPALSDKAASSLAVSRGRQRYSKNVMALYVIAFGLFLERNFEKR
jgi:hypothetical protein